MKNLKILIDREQEQLATIGMISEMKGNIDGTVNFSECGITNEMDDEEIEEFLIERHDDYSVSVEFV